MMPEFEKPKYKIRTNRFDIFGDEVFRDESLGNPRTVFQAWHHSEDIPRPVCIVVVNQCFGNYVEWAETFDGFRRQGIATEVLRAIELEIGGITIHAVTESGTAFCDAYEEMYPEEVV